MKLRESGYCIVPDKNDKSTIPDDGLHAFVCPHCGNNVFEGKDIKCYDDDRVWHRFRCWGGFGIEEYTWIPHKCTACNAKFLAWTAKKKVNGSVIGYFIGMAICTILAFASIAGAIAIEPVMAAFLMIFLPAIICCLFGVEESTLDKTENAMKEMIDRTCFPDDEEEDEEADITEDWFQQTNNVNASLRSLASACAVTPEEAERVICCFTMPKSEEGN